MDQSGFYLLPAVVRTYAPVGQSLSCKSGSLAIMCPLISAISLEGKLYTMEQDRAFNDIVGDERYLVSMLREKANCVGNVKAAGGNVTLRHGRREEVRLVEVAPDRRAPVLKAYLKRAPGARSHVPVDMDAPLAEFERVAPRFPVFRVVSRDIP